MHVSEWLCNDPRASFENWKELSRQKKLELNSMDKEKMHQFQTHGEVCKDLEGTKKERLEIE